jgi:hypothetical protein
MSSFFCYIVFIDHFLELSHHHILRRIDMRRFVACVAFSMFTLSGPASAQGVFDMGALTNSIATNAGATTTGGQQTSAISIDVLKYTPSAKLSAENLTKFFSSLNELSPGMGTQLEQGLAGQDLFAQLDQELTKYGVRPNDMGDAMAVYWLSTWFAVNGRTDDPTPAQISGTRKMVQDALVKVPDIAKLSNDDKQATAQGFLLQLFLNEIVLEGVKSDPAALKKVHGDMLAAAKTMSGFDAALFDMSPSGLVRKNIKK